MIFLDGYEEIDLQAFLNLNAGFNRAFKCGVLIEKKKGLKPLELPRSSFFIYPIVFLSIILRKF